MRSDDPTEPEGVAPAGGGPAPDAGDGPVPSAGGWAAAPPPPPAGQEPPALGPPRASQKRWSLWRAQGAKRTEGGLEAGADRVERSLRSWLPADSPWVLAASAVLVAYVLAWADALLAAVQHGSYDSAQDRLLALLGPATAGYAALLLVAVLLLDVGIYCGRPAATETRVRKAVAAAGATIVLAGGVRIVVYLADVGNGVDAAFRGIVHEIVAMAVALVASLAAWRLRPVRSA